MAGRGPELITAGAVFEENREKLWRIAYRNRQPKASAAARFELTVNIKDARPGSVSEETRFEAAYRAIMQCAMIALWANAYRPSKSVPGHHMTLIRMIDVKAGEAYA